MHMPTSGSPSGSDRAQRESLVDAFLGLADGAGLVIGVGEGAPECDLGLGLVAQLAGLEAGAGLAEHLEGGLGAPGLRGQAE
jgi:hypothetical protein